MKTRKNEYYTVLRYIIYKQEITKTVPGQNPVPENIYSSEYIFTD